MIYLYEIFLKVGRVPVSIFCRLYCPIKVEGLDRIPSAGGVILAGNHRSNADGVLVQLICRRPVSFFLYEWYYYHWLAYWFFKFVRCIPVHKDKKNLVNLKAGVKALQQGGAVGIFPEGGRTAGVPFRRGHLGAAYLARESQCPVVPIYIGNTDKLMPIGAWLPRPARLIFRFGRPITINESESLRDFTNRLMQSIAELSRETL